MTKFYETQGGEILAYNKNFTIDIINFTSTTNYFIVVTPLGYKE